MSKETPLVSVVMPSYNSMPYIKEAIESILAQTYKNFEFIIVDGHSTDGTEELIKEYQAKDLRIKLVYDNGLGVGEANNVGCLAAKGKYIAKFDSDDLSYPNRLEKQVHFLENHNDFVLISCPIDIIDGDGNLIRRTFACTNVDTLMKSMYKTGAVVHSMSMFRKDAFLKTGGYKPLKRLEDYLFLSRLWRIGNFYNHRTPLGAYRVLPNSLFHENNPYSPIISSFVFKLAKDDKLLDTDIVLYNGLCDYSKKFVTRHDKISTDKGLMYIIYEFLRKIMGKNIAEIILTNVTNIVYKRRYCQ